VLIKPGQRFGVVCKTEMSATRNSFAALICMNTRTHRYKNFCLICVWNTTVWPKIICYCSLFWQFFMVVFIKKTLNFTPWWFFLEKGCCKVAFSTKTFLPKLASTRKVRLGKVSLVVARDVRTQVFSSPTPLLIQEVGILFLIRILFATQIWNPNPEKSY